MHGHGHCRARRRSSSRARRSGRRLTSAVWLIQECAFAAGSTSYNIQNKESDGHRCFCNNSNPNDTMITIYRELADHSRQVSQRKTKHILAIKCKTKTECIMIINIHMHTASQNMKDFPDELHRFDDMTGDLCREGCHSPTTIMIGGDWNAHITRQAMSADEDAAVPSDERTESITRYLQKWDMMRTEGISSEVDNDMWAYITKHGNKKEFDHIFCNNTKSCYGPPSMGRRSDHRPMSYNKAASEAGIVEIRPRQLHMFGWRPSVSAARRLARAWAEWTPACMSDAQRGEHNRRRRGSMPQSEGPQARLGATAQERRVSDIHVKLERAHSRSHDRGRQRRCSSKDWSRQMAHS